VFLGLSVPAVRARVQRHQIPHFRLGRRVFFDRVRLEAWLAAMNNRDG